MPTLMLRLLQPLGCCNGTEPRGLRRSPLSGEEVLKLLRCRIHSHKTRPRGFRWRVRRERAVRRRLATFGRRAYVYAPLLLKSAGGLSNPCVLSNGGQPFRLSVAFDCTAGLASRHGFAICSARGAPTVEWEGMTGGRSRGGSGGLGGPDQAPRLPGEPVDEGQAVLPCTATIGKRGETRTHAGVAPSAIVPTAGRARNLVGQLEGSAQKVRRRLCSPFDQEAPARFATLVYRHLLW